MSMLGMLGKVAMGIMVAKTVGKAMGGSGGLGDMLGGLLGGKNATSSSDAQGGKLGNLLNNLGGNDNKSGNNGLGDLLSSTLAGKRVDTTPSEEEKAMILLKAMIQAAKSDGKMDAEENAKIIQHIGEVSQEEIDFVKKELDAPLDLEGLIKITPRGMEQQVYLMSLLAINLDSNEEAHYLDKLAQGLGINHQMANAIHQQAGVRPIYSA